MSYTNKTINAINDRTNAIIVNEQDRLINIIDDKLKDLNATNPKRYKLEAYKLLLNTTSVNWQTYKFLEKQIKGVR